MFEAKDEIIGSLKMEATKLLKEKDDSINALQAEVYNPLRCLRRLFNNFIH